MTISDHITRGYRAAEPFAGAVAFAAFALLSHRLLRGAMILLAWGME